MSIIAENLRYVRELAELGQRELDRLAERTEGHCGLIESRPDSDVHASTLVASSTVFGITLDWLVLSRGPAPQAAAVKAAVARARARLESRVARTPPPPPPTPGKKRRGKGRRTQPRLPRDRQASQRVAA